MWSPQKYIKKNLLSYTFPYTCTFLKKQSSNNYRFGNLRYHKTSQKQKLVEQNPPIFIINGCLATVLETNSNKYYFPNVNFTLKLVSIYGNILFKRMLLPYYVLYYIACNFIKLYIS